MRAVERATSAEQHPDVANLNLAESCMLPDLDLVEAMQETSDRPALRALYLRRFWYSTAAGVTATFYYLSAVTIIVLSTTVAARPSFFGPWTSDKISDLLYVIAVLTALATLVPWRRFAIAFRKAHELLVDVMALYRAGDASVADMFRVAAEAKRLIAIATETAG
jgi:hypothetical protein